MKEIQKFTLVLFKLPDGRVMLQRRTQDAPYAPGKLGIFGGWVEKGESVMECLIREIHEETSLDADKLTFTEVVDFIMPKGDDFSEDRHFYLFTTEIESPDFEVYEGDRAEALQLGQITDRDDLTGSAEFVFREIIPKQLDKL